MVDTILWYKSTGKEVDTIWVDKSTGKEVDGVGVEKSTKIFSEWLKIIVDFSKKILSPHRQ